MAVIVPRQKRNALAAQCRQRVGARRIAEWRRQDMFFAIRELRHIVQPTPADDSDLRVHKILSTIRWPALSRSRPAASDGSCSNMIKYSRSIASRAKARLKLSVSMGYKSYPMIQASATC